MCNPTRSMRRGRFGRWHLEKLVCRIKHPFKTGLAPVSRTRFQLGNVTLVHLSKTSELLHLRALCLPERCSRPQWMLKYHISCTLGAVVFPTCCIRVPYNVRFFGKRPRKQHGGPAKLPDQQVVTSILVLDQVRLL